MRVLAIVDRFAPIKFARLIEKRISVAAFDQRIVRTGEAHIDDLCAVRRRVIECLQDHERRALPAVRRHRESADRQNPRCRSAAHQPRVRHDRAGDAGAVDVRTFLAAERIE